jgi:Ca2+-binding RTX toxin-like protein
MTLESIENFEGRAGTFDFTGSSADNFVFLGDGNDTIRGGLGQDTLFGSSGSDVYVFDVAPGEANADEVLSFDKFPDWGELDRLFLDDSVMPALGATGQMSEDDDRFYAAAGATGGADGEDRVVYDTDTGRLYYDADGSGLGGAQLIATVHVSSMTGATLVATDITVI